MKGALMVCGTTSDAGKSHVVTGLCRLLHRRGVRVAPFKAQNMSLNSFVTADGAEIGRAQGVQALAAGVEPEAAMNPVLLKPATDRASQVVVRGRPWSEMDAAAYHQAKPALLPVVLDALDDLRARYDVVVLEGAGSAAEINLLDRDIVNLPLAAERDIPAVVVGDIDRGGVFASFYGTVALLPDRYRRLVRGFVINKFRGDPSLLGDATADLERRCGVPTLGVIPFLPGVQLDAEDSLALATFDTFGGAGGSDAHGPAALDVAVVRLPHISNFTDFDPLAVEPGVAVRLVGHGAALGRPDLVVIPGTKATLADLDWLRQAGFVEAIEASGADVLGICGGYQMMGRTIADTIESRRGEVAGLGWLDVHTTFGAGKVVRRRRGTALGAPVSGYQIHHGRVTGGVGWIRLDGGEGEGAACTGTADRIGTTLHGLFEEDGFRAAFLGALAARRGKPFAPSGTSFAAARQAQFDRLADALEEHVDMASVDALIGGAAL